MTAHPSAPRDALVAALRRAGFQAAAITRYHRSVTPRGRFDWRWQIVDDARSPHVIAASGRAWTRRRAWKRLEKAYDRLLNQAADGRAES